MELGESGQTLNMSDRLDFNPRFKGEACCLDACSGREILCEIFSVDDVEPSKLIHIQQVNGHLNNILQGRARLFKDDLQVL